MERTEPEKPSQHIVSCWQCGALFDTLDAPFCDHSDPTKLCPFCLKCFCDAPREFRDDFEKRNPGALRREKGTRGIKLGELLIREGKITRDQLKHAMDHQAFSKRPLGEVLMLMELIDPGELQHILARQRSINR